jgi:putative selenate reductase
VERFRERFQDRIPISFAAGIDRGNFPDAVALGLVPITVCSDLLKPGGYGRLSTYYRELSRRMTEAKAATVDEFAIRAFGQGEAALAEVAGGDPDVLAAGRAALEGPRPLREAVTEETYARWVGAARLRNTPLYAQRAAEDPRYALDQNRKLPKKIGSHLQLFDCISCDKCIPVCPNDANFAFVPAGDAIPVVQVVKRGTGWGWNPRGTTRLREKHQIGTFADFCNECGNCDIFCPEDGGPYLMKPRFFARETTFREADPLEGFFVERTGETDRVLARFPTGEFELEVRQGEWTFRGKDFELRFDPDRPEATISGRGPTEIDLTYCHIMDAVRGGVLDSGQVNYVNSLVELS